MAQPTHTEAAERQVGADEPGWLPRATFGVCVGCGKDADYLWHGGDVFIPVCEGCACDVLHRDAPPPGAPMWCPKCQITWGEESSRAAKASGPAAIVPDEVKRLRLEPGDKLIVRVSDTWNPRQIREYQDYLQHAVPDNQVLVLPGEQVLTAGPGEPQGEETAPEFVFGYECVRAEQERRALIRDHPQPFASDCSHEIVSLPVIDERFDFQCRRCGGVESVSWIAQFSGESFEDVCQLVAKATGGVFVGHASETTVVQPDNHDDVLHIAGRVHVDWIGPRGHDGRMPAVFAELQIQDAETGEYLTGATSVTIRCANDEYDGLARVEITELLGDDGKPIRNGQQWLGTEDTAASTYVLVPSTRSDAAAAAGPDFAPAFAMQQTRPEIRTNPRLLADDCRHQFTLLPISDTALDFECQRCHGTITQSWEPGFAGLSFNDVGQRVAERHGGVYVPAPRALTGGEYASESADVTAE